VIVAILGNQLSIYLNANSSAGYVLMLVAGGLAGTMHGGSLALESDTTGYNDHPANGLG
jgi:hypothetical protein